MRDSKHLLLLSGALVWLVAFFLLPLLMILLVSFAQRGTYGDIKFICTLDNYVRSLDPLYLKIYWRSLGVAVITTLICLVLAYPIAYYIARQANPKKRNLLLLLVVLPFWTSFLIRTYAWILLLRTEGLINTLLLSLHLIEQPLRLLYSNFAVVLGLVYGELPFMILPLYASLQKLDRSLLEAAQDLGANPFWTLIKVILPLTKPGMIVGTVFVFIPSLGAFITPDLLGGAKSIMIGNLIQNQFAVARNQPFGAALAFLLTFVVLVLLFISRRAGGIAERMKDEG
jgi:spermidine/putrescine transport system permease protein